VPRSEPTARRARTRARASTSGVRRRSSRWLESLLHPPLHEGTDRTGASAARRRGTAPTSGTPTPACACAASEVSVGAGSSGGGSSLHHGGVRAWRSPASIAARRAFPYAS
jgi:hypothetical protein